MDLVHLYEQISDQEAGFPQEASCDFPRVLASDLPCEQTRGNGEGKAVEMEKF